MCQGASIVRWLTDIQIETANEDFNYSHLKYTLPLDAEYRTLKIPEQS